MNKRLLLSAMVLSSLLIPVVRLPAQSSSRDMLYYDKVD